MTPELLCTSLLAALGITAPDRHEVCVEVALAALHAGDDPAEVAAQSWVESNFVPTAHRGGCHGPLGADVTLWCPDKRLEGCDLIAAGLAARRAYRAAWRDKVDFLCAYNKGSKGYREHVAVYGRGCSYAAKVLKLREKAR